MLGWWRPRRGGLATPPRYTLATGTSSSAQFRPWAQHPDPALLSDERLHAWPVTAGSATNSPNEAINSGLVNGGSPRSTTRPDGRPRYTRP
jgi:hypothetical protein